MSEQWGPWIEHDGLGCPVRGQWVQAEGQGMAREGIAGSDGDRSVLLGFNRDGSWDWSNGPDCWRIERYRIRRPRALLQLIDMAENLPAPKQREEA